MTVLVTSWSLNGEQLYGRDFLFNAHRFSVEKLLVYEEQDSGRADHVNLLSLGTWRRFEALADMRQGARGDCSMIGRWKRQEVEKGYCYRYDALKFCRKLFALHDACLLSPGHTVVWSDGDVVPLAGAVVPVGFFDALVTPRTVAYLGRDRPHSECGMVVYGRDVALDLTTWMVNRCISGELFDDPDGWTDCHVFDAARRALPEIDWLDLTRGPRHGAVFESSVFGRYFTHLKGDRKNATRR